MLVIHITLVKITVFSPINNQVDVGDVSGRQVYIPKKIYQNFCSELSCLQTEGHICKHASTTKNITSLAVVIIPPYS